TATPDAPDARSLLVDPLKASPSRAPIAASLRCLGRGPLSSLSAVRVHAAPRFRHAWRTRAPCLLDPVHAVARRDGRGGADGNTVRDGASGLAHPRDAGHRSHGGDVAYTTDLFFLPPPVAADRRGARRAIPRHSRGRDAAPQERGGRDDDDRIARAAGAGLPANRSRHRAWDTTVHGRTGA